MHTHADKTQENNSQSVANTISQKQSSSESTFQLVENRPEAIAQRKLQVMANNSPQAQKAVQLQAMADDYAAQQQHPIQIKASPEPGRRENKTGLPDNLKAGIENLSGYSMDDVRVHSNSDKPAQLNALAYTQGTDIYLKPGQETHLEHEAWHVVQQIQGRVRPTIHTKGVSINDDASLESEADVMGSKSATYVPSTGDSEAQGTERSGTKFNTPIQMKRVPTHLGVFEDETYTDNGSDRVSMVLKFEPGAKVNATKIGLVQSVKNQNRGTPFALDPQKEHRIVKSGTGKGYGMDRLTSRNTPIYGSDDLGAGKGLEDTKQDNNPTTDPTKVDTRAAGGNATYQLGHRFYDGTLKKKDAKLHDAPRGFSTANSGLEFETTALALEGTQKGTYYGSVKWGYKVDAAGTFKKIDFEIVSKGVPSRNFLAPANVWNSSKTRGTMVIKTDNTPILDGSLAEKFKAAKDDEFIYKSSSKAGNQVYCFVEKKGDATKNGMVKIEQIKDKGDGKEMVDLPIPIVLVTTKKVSLTSDVEGKSKIVDLPKDTRVKNTFCHKSGKYKIDVVDGVHIGKSGYVNGTDLTYEK